MLYFFVGKIHDMSHLHEFMGATRPRKILTFVTGVVLLYSFQVKQELTSYQLTFSSYKQLKYSHAWAHTKTVSNLTLIYVSSKVIRKVPMIDF